MNPACVRFGALALALLCFPLVAGAQAGDTCEWAYCYSYGYYDSGSATVYGASVVDADGFYVDVDAAVIGPYNGIYDEAEAGDWCTAEADVSAQVSDGLYFIDALNYVDYDCEGESWSDWISAGAQAYLTGIYPDNWTAGSIQNFTISGGDFGSSPSIIVTQGGVTLPSCGDNCGGSDTSIPAWVDLTGASGGTAIIAVSNNDYNSEIGMGFYPGSGGSGGAPTGDSGSAQITALPTVGIVYASVAEDDITIDLQPGSASGVLTVRLTGSSPRTLTETSYAGGVPHIHFNVPSLPDGQEYTGISASWAVTGSPSAYYAYHIKVLGTYSNTMYNTPTEAYCSGTRATRTNSTGDCGARYNCQSSPFQAKSDWWSQTQLNGSGQSDPLGVVSLEYVCSTDVRQTGVTCPKCGGTLVPGTSVARNVGNSDLPCGAQVYVYGIGTRTVADAGGGLDMTQLDHYNGFGACNRNAGTLGDAKVVRVY